MLRRFRTLRWLLALTLLAAAGPARASSADNVVDWSGISHVPTLDRRPLCPVGGETFTVLFQTWKNDLTGAGVHVSDGTSTTDVAATKVWTHGPYDTWSAQVPATTASSEFYWITLTDGTTTDYLSVNGLSHTVPADGGYALNFTTLVHAPVGATPVTGGGAVFRVWAPQAVSCYVRGDFNSWGMGNPLTKSGEYFTGKVATVADRASYKYFFNNATWNTDARARSLDAANGPYNARVENPFRFTWSDSAWTPPALDSLVVYQLHVGTFCGYNDPVGTTTFPAHYRDVAARAAHLKDLGVNCVMLNPITEFPTDVSAGYNPITAWSPEWAYGTPDDFKYLVNALHANGIAVVLDIVWNHVSPSDNNLWNYDGYQEYFENPDVQTSWGSQCAFGKTGVADYYANSAQLWFGEYHVDGFRMDATYSMTTGTHSTSGWQLMQRLNNEKNNRYADHACIAEQLPSYDSYVQPTSAGGAGFDAEYQMQFRDNVRAAMFAGPTGDPNMAGVRSALIGTDATIVGTRAVNYVELHDEAWPTNGGQRMVKTLDPASPYDNATAQGFSKLGLSCVLTSQGVPAMLMGDEWLENIDWGPNSANRIDWSKQTTYAPIYRYYQRLITLRRTLSPLRASAATYVSHVNEGGNVIAWRRMDAQGNPVMVIANFSNTNFATYRFGVPLSGNWSELVNSQDPQYGGSGPVDSGWLAADTGQPYDGFNQSVAIALPAMAFVVLGPQGLVDVPPASHVAALELAAPWPNPAHGAARLAFTLPAATTGSLEVLDLAGRRVRTLAAGALAAGPHVLTWDGADAQGHAASAGVYFARLATALGTRTVRIARLP